MIYSISKLSEKYQVSQRTIRYYEEIGLITPDINPVTRKKTFSEKNRLRLAEILVLKKYRFSLENIKVLVDSSSLELLSALKSQEIELEQKVQGLNTAIKSIKNAILYMENNENMDIDKLYENYPEMAKYREEAVNKWGQEVIDTETRLLAMETQESAQLADMSLTIGRMVAGEMHRSPSDPQTQKIIELHYKYICKFYNANRERYENLAEMYVSDARFAKYYNDIKPGLAKYLAQGMTIYATQNL